MALVPSDDGVRLEAEAFLGLGLGLTGHVPEGLAFYESSLARMTGEEGSTAERARMAKGWLQLVIDDLAGAPRTLEETARSQLRAGSIRIAVWAYAWLSRANFLLGAWDEAAAAATRAVLLLEDTGHEWLRPLARWMAVCVSATRGEWSAADEHARRAAAGPTDYELMIVTAALANAELAAARADHKAVLKRWSRS